MNITNMGLKLPPAPYPDAGFRLSADSVDNVKTWSQGYFNHIIGVYDIGIQDTLSEMYYDGVNVTTSDVLLEKTNAFGMAQKLRDDGRIIGTRVTLDTHIAAAPVVAMWIRNHEIAVHAGQNFYHNQTGFYQPEPGSSDVRFDALGRWQRPNERALSAFKVGRDFDEMCAAACDYHFLHPLTPAVAQQTITELPSFCWAGRDGLVDLQTRVAERLDAARTGSLHDYLDMRADLYGFDAQTLANFKKNFDTGGHPVTPANAPGPTP